LTLNDVQRAQLALFAARAAGQGASLEQMKAIAYCIRNRVKAGWWDGQWLTVMEHAGEIEANELDEPWYLDLNNRALQRLVADIDEIYYGGRTAGGARVEQAPMVAQRYAAESTDLEEAIGKSVYWAWLNRPFTTWFRENVLEQSHNHPNRAQMGMMVFFE
jgi:hypothetical protein